jgi:CheY-like chemotaxis protein
MVQTMKKMRPLMIVEDSDEDFEVIYWALQKTGCAHPIIRTERAEEALSRLFPGLPQIDRIDQLPCLMLLDLNLPGMNGLQMLKELRQMQQPLSIPIVVMSTSSNPVDIAACYNFGVAGYILKPFKLDQYIEKVKDLTHYWFNTVILPEEKCDGG